MNETSSIPPVPAPAKSWWGRLAWWKKCGVIFLASILSTVAVDYAVNNLFMPEYASPKAIETKYKEQVDRLKELASNPTLHWNTTVESCATDRAIFSPPEILSAKLEVSPNCFTGFGQKSQSWKSQWQFFWNTHSTCTKKLFRTLNDGRKMTVIVYQTTVANPRANDGEIKVFLEFDLAKLNP